MAIHPTIIKDLISSGAILKITSEHHPQNLKDFVSLAMQKNVPITIRVEHLHPDNIKDLIKVGHKTLTLEL